MDFSLSDEDRAQFADLTPAQTQQLTSQLIREDKKQIVDLKNRILALRNHVCALRRVRNNAALINVKLPVEILVVILRMAGSWRSSKYAMLLTHVCHAWRTVIHATPVYWVDFLSPYTENYPFGQKGEDPSIILAALARSASMPLKLALSGGFLSLYKHPYAKPHFSRITVLILDLPGEEHRDIRPLYNLRLPMLDRLQIHMDYRKLVIPSGCSGFPLLVWSTVHSHPSSTITSTLSGAPSDLVSTTLTELTSLSSCVSSDRLVHIFMT